MLANTRKYYKMFKNLKDNTHTHKNTYRHIKSDKIQSIYYDIQNL